VDVTQALSDTENALRDFIGGVLSRSLGPEWVDKCGVSPERVEVWRERKRVEGARQEAGVVEERLIYYADFYDLKTILKKHWSGEFSDALGDWKTMEVWLAELERLRDPDAHRRELLPHQKNLALGIAGEIGTRLVRYRSKRETTEDCFPRIESARDSLGNMWTPGMVWVDTGVVLRPGDTVDFVLTARDPEGADLEYGIKFDAFGPNWQKEPAFNVRFTESHIAKSLFLELYVRSTRSYHALGDWDDKATFVYKVLPKRDA
jgi:Swt1-like HEPN